VPRRQTEQSKNDPPSNNDPPPSPINRSADSVEDSRREWIMGLGQLTVAYIGISGLLTHPFGFLTFLVQLARGYEIDYATALYAASLIPASSIVAKILPILGWSILTLYVPLVGVIYLKHKSALYVILVPGLFGLASLLSCFSRVEW
jgi:hypothetical protein